MTLVERVSRCVVGWAVGADRSETVLQALVDDAPLMYSSSSRPMPLDTPKREFVDGTICLWPSEPERRKGPLS